MVKKVIPPAVEVLVEKKSTLGTVFFHLGLLVRNVENLEGESRERLNDKKAMVEGILLSAIVEIGKVLGR